MTVRQARLQRQRNIKKRNMQKKTDLKHVLNSFRKFSEKLRRHTITKRLKKPKRKSKLRLNSSRLLVLIQRNLLTTAHTFQEPLSLCLMQKSF